MDNKSTNCDNSKKFSFFSFHSLYTAIHPHGQSRQVGAASVSTRHKKGRFIVQRFKSIKVKNKTDDRL